MHPRFVAFWNVVGLPASAGQRGRSGANRRKRKTRRKAVMIDVLGISGYELVPICELVGVLEGDWLKRDEVQ